MEAMRANVRKVFRCWNDGKACSGDSKRTIWTDGKVIYSYNLPIRVVVDGYVYQRSPMDGGMSITTSTQVRSLFDPREACVSPEGMRRAVQYGEVPETRWCQTFDQALRMMANPKALPPRESAKRAALEARTHAVLLVKQAGELQRRVKSAEARGETKTADALHRQLVQLDVELAKHQTPDPVDAERVSHFYGARTRRCRRRG